MELASRVISTKYNTKVGFYSHGYQISKTKLDNLTLVDKECLTLEQFCVELPKLIESHKYKNLKSKNKEIEDLLR